jgi:hypothetical protein
MMLMMIILLTVEEYISSRMACMTEFSTNDLPVQVPVSPCNKIDEFFVIFLVQ